MAGLLAIYLYQSQGSVFRALMVGYLGLINFQLLQAIQYQGSAGAFQEEEDWWRR